MPVYPFVRPTSAAWMKSLRSVEMGIYATWGITSLEQLSNNPEMRKRMGMQAQSSARKQFSIESMARETLSIYNQVMDQSQ